MTPEINQLRELCRRNITSNRSRDPYVQGKIDMAEAVLAVLNDSLKVPGP